MIAKNGGLGLGECHKRYYLKKIFILFLSRFKAAVLQMLKNMKRKNKINGKYWSSYVQWRNLLLLTP